MPSPMFRGGVANITTDERTNRTMRKHLLAVACLASLGLASPAKAVTILQFTQSNATDQVTATTVGAVTTFTTNSATQPGFIPVNLANLAGIGGPAGTASGFEQFTNVVSTSTAGVTAGQINQTYSGTISFYGQVVGGVGNPASLFLQATFNIGNFNGPVSGTSATLNASAPPNVVNFTSANPQISAILALGTTERALALAFSNIFPALGTTGTALNGFTAQNSGTFSVTPIPEPASIVSSSLALLAGLGGYRWRRKSA